MLPSGFCASAPLPKASARQRFASARQRFALCASANKTAYGVVTNKKVMEELTSMLATANEMLSSGVLDDVQFRKIENFVIKNEHSLSSRPEFVALTKVVDELARKHDKPTIKEQRENFGLNSCAC